MTARSPTTAARAANREESWPTGLRSEQVDALRRRGDVNTVPSVDSRSVAAILVTKVFTPCRMYGPRPVKKRQACPADLVLQRHSFSGGRQVVERRPPTRSEEWNELSVGETGLEPATPGPPDQYSFVGVKSSSECS
jgi:hypothetical protein